MMVFGDSGGCIVGMWLVKIDVKLNFVVVFIKCFLMVFVLGV